MKTILIGALLVAAPAFAAGKVEDAITAVSAQLEACMAKNDAACLGQLFTDDATFVGPLSGYKLIAGRDQIIKFITGRLSVRNVKQKRVVQNLRLIGRDHALVDCSLEFEKRTLREGMRPDAPREVWRSTALLTLRDGKWLMEDVRFYFYLVASAPSPKAAPPPPPKQPATPAAG